MEIGFNIRELRNQSGLTILELAKQAGVSGESVRVLENSNSPKTITVLVKFSQLWVLNCVLIW